MAFSVELLGVDLSETTTTALFEVGTTTRGDDGAIYEYRLISGVYQWVSYWWDDLRFPATAINPPGAASDPDVEATSGLLLFDAGSTELVYALAQLPHAWAIGTTIRPHVHWQKTTSAAGTVLWQCSYKKAPIGEVMDAAWTDLSNDSPAVSDDDTADKHALTAFGDIDGSALTISDCILFKISRLGGSDTYGADARLLEFDMHVQIDAFGSGAEFVK